MNKRKRSDIGALLGLGVFMVTATFAAACLLEKKYPEAILFGLVAFFGGVAAIPLTNA